MARFLILLLVLTLPFWALAWAVQAEPLPGLPLSALMAFMPAAAALVLAGRAGGGAAVKRLLARSFDAARLRGHARWAPLILLAPAIAAVSWALQGHAPAAGPPPWVLLAMLGAFFVAALGEELGWTAWLLEPLSRRHGELSAALLVGAAWAAWHLVPFLQAGRAWDWIAWQCAKTVAERVVMARLYFAAGRSVFAVTLFHALGNLAAFGLPMYGGTYDPAFTAMAMVAAAAALTLARRRA